MVETKTSPVQMAERLADNLIESLRDEFGIELGDKQPLFRQHVIETYREQYEGEWTE